MHLIITLLTLIITPHLFAQTSKPSLPETKSVKVQDDRVIAFNKLKVKALTGDLQSIYELARFYETGVKNVCPKNLNLSFDLYHYAANTGYKEAQFRLMIRYIDQEVPISYSLTKSYKMDNQSDNLDDNDLLAEAYKWSLISGYPFPPTQISESNKAEGFRRAEELAVTHKFKRPLPKGIVEDLNNATYEDYDKKK
jgi:TPR repeat protein